MLYFLIYISIIIIVVLFICKYIDNNMNNNYSISGAYLNYSSTNAIKNNSFNPSDISYPQNILLRSNINELKDKIKSIVNAPASSKVIFNSGATESIANCIFWISNINKYGVVIGSSFDHSSIKDNCDNFNVNYIQDDEFMFNNGELNDKCSAVILTHVTSKTGEIIDINNVAKSLNKYTYISETNNTIMSDQHFTNIRQYRPLFIVDATQSIMKLPIDMKNNNIDALFFSLHKIGGPIGLGVLVVNNKTFKPLISGKQQDSLRGGTMQLQSLDKSKSLFYEYDDYSKRIDKWNEVYSKFVKSGLNVYTPQHNHLYNTFLIKVNTCPLSLINELANEQIYIGNISACKNEETSTNDNEDKFVRISFMKPEELNDDIINNIVNKLIDK